MLHRRQFLVGAGTLAGAAFIPGWLNAKSIDSSWLVSAYSSSDKQHFAGAFNMQGQFINRVLLPARGHGAVPHPLKKGTAIVYARRPGTFLMEVDFAQGKITQHVTAAPSNHFFGHGVFSADGQTLISIENNFEQGRGEVVLRDSNNYQIIDIFDAGGVGPHQCCLMPDGKTLVIANGGIKTHPDWPRKKLNLETMSPALTYLDLTSGKIIGQYRLENHQLSIRHLDVSAKGKVIAGLQYQGPKTNQVALAISHQGEDSLQFLQADNHVWRAMNQYTASVQINDASNSVAISCPRGNRVTFWDLTSNGYLEKVNLRDAAGLSLVDQAFVASSGKGTVIQQQTAIESPMKRLQFKDIRWDNHLTTIQGT